MVVMVVVVVIVCNCRPVFDINNVVGLVNDGGMPMVREMVFSRLIPSLCG